MTKKTLDLNLIVYSNPEVESIIKDRSNKALVTAESRAKLNALLFYPPETGVSLKSACRFLSEHYNELLCEVNSLINGPMQIQLGSLERSDIENRQLEIDKEIIRLERKTKELDQGEDRKSIFTTSVSAFFVFAFLAILVSGELIYLASSLQVMLPNILACIIISLGTVASLGLSTHLGEIWLMNNFQTKPLRRIIRLIYFFAVFLLFVCFGTIRAKYLNTVSNHSFYDSIWFFAFLNLLFYGAVFLFLEYIIIPFIPKFKDALRGWKIKREKGRKELELKALKAKKEFNKTSLKVTLIDKLEITHYHRNTESRIDRLYRRDIGIYMDTNLESRVDGIIPQAFSEDPEELNFFTNDLKL